MKTSDVIVFIRELIQPMCARMALAAGTRHQIETALDTLWRLLEPSVDRRTQIRFVFREPFNDALGFLELYAFFSGKYVDVFRQWQQFAQRARAPPTPRRPFWRRRSGEADGGRSPGGRPAVQRRVSLHFLIPSPGSALRASSTS